MPVIAVGRLGDPALAEVGGRERQDRFHRARPHAGCRSAMGRESRARRADPPLPRLQHLHQRNARRRAHRLRRQRRRRPRNCVRRSAAAARRAHRRDRRRTGRPHLCVAGRRRQHRDRVREGGPRRRQLPLRRQGAAVPGGRSQSEKLRALHRRSGRGLQDERRHVPLRNRRRPPRRICWSRSIASSIATGAAYRFGLGAARDNGARQRRRALARHRAVVVIAEVARLVLLPRRDATGRPIQAARAAGTNRHRDRRCGAAPARASRRSPAPSRRRFWASSRAELLPNLRAFPSRYPMARLLLYAIRGDAGTPWTHARETSSRSGQHGVQDAERRLCRRWRR